MLHHLQHEVRGIERLDPYFSSRPFPAGSSRHLLQHLVCPFVCPEIGLVEERVGVENRHQPHVVEMQPFRHHLGAYQDVTFMVGESVDDILVSRPVAGGVQIHTQHAGVRKEGLYLVLYPLGAEPDGFVFAAAMRAEVRYRRVIAAIMAPHLLVAQMQGHRHVALHAPRRLAAGGTLYLGGIAASVLEEDDLFALRQHPADLRYQRVTEMAVHLFAFILASEINQPYLRQLRATETLRYLHQAVHPFLRQIVRLQRRGGCPQQHFGAMLFRQHDRCRTGVITGSRLFLFVTRLMLFVHDNDTYLGYGHEDGTPRPDDHIRMSGSRLRSDPAEFAVPLFALGVRQTAVIDNQPVSEHMLQPAGELGRQSDLRHQIEHVLPLLQLRPDQMDIDIRLAAGGDAMEQYYILAGRPETFDFIDTFLLRRRQ